MNHQRRMGVVRLILQTRERPPLFPCCWVAPPRSEVVANRRRHAVDVRRVGVTGLAVDGGLLRLAREDELRLGGHVDLHRVLEDLQRVGEVEANAAGHSDGVPVHQVGALGVLLRHGRGAEEGAQAGGEALGHAVLGAGAHAQGVGEARLPRRRGDVERRAEPQRLQGGSGEIDVDAHVGRGRGAPVLPLAVDGEGQIFGGVEGRSEVEGVGGVVRHARHREAQGADARDVHLGGDHHQQLHLPLEGDAQAQPGNGRDGQGEDRGDAGGEVGVEIAALHFLAEEIDRDVGAAADQVRQRLDAQADLEPVDDLDAGAEVQNQALGAGVVAVPVRAVRRWRC